MPPPKSTTKCALCRVEKDKFKEFYAPEDKVCKKCNTDFVFIKTLKRLAREQGLEALQTRIEDYMRRARIARKVFKAMSRT